MKTPLNPFLALVVLLSVVGGTCLGQSDTRPNILLIVSDDIVEVHELKGFHPEKFRELLSEWDRFAEEIRVQFPTPKQM